MVIEEDIFCISWLCCFVGWFICWRRKIRGGGGGDGGWCCYNLDRRNISIKQLYDL